MVLGKNPPGNPRIPDPKLYPIPKLTLTLPLTPHGWLFFRGGFFLDTGFNLLIMKLWLYKIQSLFALNDLSWMKEFFYIIKDVDLNGLSWMKKSFYIVKFFKSNSLSWTKEFFYPSKIQEKKSDSEDNTLLYSLICKLALSVCNMSSFGIVRSSHGFWV